MKKSAFCVGVLYLHAELRDQPQIAAPVVWMLSLMETAKQLLCTSDAKDIQHVVPK